MSHTARKQITLRGFPDKIYQELQTEARRTRKSMNELLLKRLLGEPPKKTEGACAELLSLAGTWDSSQAKDFETQMRRHRKIDKELWS